MHPKVAETLNGVGSVHMAARRWDDAVLAFQRALEISVNSFGEKVLLE